MKEQPISLETSKLAKEVGFQFEFEDDENYDFGYHSYFQHYRSGKIAALSHLYIDINANGVQWKETGYDAPTLSLLHKYIIEKYGIYVFVIPTVTSDWTFKTITVLSERDNDVILGLKSVSDLPPYKDVNGFDYSTHDVALEAGLVKAMEEIIKNK